MNHAGKEADGFPDTVDLHPKGWGIDALVISSFSAGISILPHEVRIACEEVHRLFGIIREGLFVFLCQTYFGNPPLGDWAQDIIVWHYCLLVIYCLT